MPAKRQRSDATQASSDAASSTPVSPAAATSLELLHSKVISPHVSGIVAMAVNRSETRLVVARENGSLLLYKLDFFQNVCHLVKVSTTGGAKGKSIRGVHFTLDDDSGILVTYLSGQYVLFSADTLLPTAMQERTGGPILASHMCDGGRVLFAAIADGTFHGVVARSLQQLEFVAIVPKVTGANRSLCVCASLATGLLVGGDDAGHVTCWSIAAVAAQASLLSSETTGRVTVPGAAQNWCTKLGTSLPLSVLLHDASATCIVGTSIGEVVVFDMRSGSVTSSYTHHRGPVTVLALGSDNVSFYASGYHESLRCYRRQLQAAGTWLPSDVRRRTHYHEATCVLVLRKFPFLFSASRDGTIMHSRLATLFSAPVQYTDASAQIFIFSSDKQALLQTAGTSVQVLRMNSRRTQWIPVFQFVPSGAHYIKGCWANDDLTLIAITTDVRASIYRLEWEDNGLAVKSMESVWAKSIVGVQDCCFHGQDVYLLTCFAVLHLPVSIAFKEIQHSLSKTYARIVPPPAQEKGDATPSSSSPPPPAAAAFPLLLLLFGQHGTLKIPLNQDGTLHSEDAAVVVDREFTDQVASLPDGRVAALVEGQEFRVRSFSAAADSSAAVASSRLMPTLPHDAQICASLPGKTSFVASFPRGMLDASAGHWRMVKRMPVTAAFAMPSAAGSKGEDRRSTCLALERNVEGAVETLPPCWKVRRFGN